MGRRSSEVRRANKLARQNQLAQLPGAEIQNEPNDFGMELNVASGAQA